MRRLPVTTTLLGLLALSTLASCVVVVGDGHGRHRAQRGSGHRVEVERSVREFHAVEIDCAADANVTVGSATSVTLSGDDDLLQHVTTEVHDGVLEIDLDGNYEFDADLVVTITTPGLDSVEIDGAGDIMITGMRGDALSLAIDGAGDISADGSVRMLEASIDGAGGMSLMDLRTEEAVVSIDGAGNIRVHASKKLRYEIDGAGNVVYAGDPHVTGEISGAGSLTRK